MNHHLKLAYDAGSKNAIDETLVAMEKEAATADSLLERILMRGPDRPFAERAMKPRILETLARDWRASEGAASRLADPVLARALRWGAPIAGGAAALVGGAPFVPAAVMGGMVPGLMSPKPGVPGSKLPDTIARFARTGSGRAIGKAGLAGLGGLGLYHLIS